MTSVQGHAGNSTIHSRSPYIYPYMSPPGVSGCSATPRSRQVRFGGLARQQAHRVPKGPLKNVSGGLGLLGSRSRIIEGPSHEHHREVCDTLAILAVSVKWRSLKGNYGAPLKGVGVDIRQA